MANQTILNLPLYSDVRTERAKRNWPVTPHQDLRQWFVTKHGSDVWDFFCMIIGSNIAVNKMSEMITQ